MRYRDAAKLQAGDKVTVRATGATVEVLSVDRGPRLIRLYCDDWATHAHVEVAAVPKEA